MRSICRGTRSRAGSPSSGARSRADYAGREPLLVAPLKSSAVFLADLSRALPIPHTLDVVELAPYGGSRTAGAAACGCSRTWTPPIEGRHVIVVEDVVDTGLTLWFLVPDAGVARTGEPRCRDPARPSLPSPGGRASRCVTSASRVPDELFAGYGLGLDERWRALPDLHIVLAEQLPAAIDAA